MTTVPAHNEPPHDERAVDARGDARRAAILSRARAHSRLVRRLRLALPVAGVLLVASFWGSAAFNAMLRGAGLGLGALDLTALVDGELVMAEPDISGVVNGRRFEVKAVRAVQDVTRRDEVRFETASAVLDGPQGRIDLDAGRALYRMDAEILDLTQGIDVVTQRGQTARLERARVDLAAGRLQSDSPVRLSAPQGVIEAETLDIFDSGARILFKGRVRARFLPPPPERERAAGTSALEDEPSAEPDAVPGD